MPFEESAPQVSVVIPTRNRGELLLRAVRSVQQQSVTSLEILVVIDGPDAATESLLALTAAEEPRLRVIALEQSVGGAEARNVGARHARGAWVALLDDDDAWLPEKLALQLASVLGCSGEWFVGSRFIERTPGGDRVLPQVPDWRQHPSEALFLRRSLRSGTAYVQTSTWLISRSLLLRVPFTKGLRRNQDADWMLRGLSEPGVQIRIVPQALTVFFDDHDAGRVSRKADWQFHYDWALTNRRYFTPRALSFFLLTTCAQDATLRGAPWRERLFLLRESFRLGRPSFRALAFFVYYSLGPGLMQRVRARRRIQTAAAGATVSL